MKLDTSRIDTSKIDTGKIAGKIDLGRVSDFPAVRILRKWRSYDAGQIIWPAGMLRQVLLEARGEDGKPFAEVVAKAAPAAAKPERPVEIENKAVISDGGEKPEKPKMSRGKGKR